MTTWYTSENSASGPNFAMASFDESSVFSHQEFSRSRPISRTLWSSSSSSSSGTARKSVTFERNSPVETKADYFFGENTGGSGMYKRIISRCSGNSRFPRVEDMPHFHYDFVDLGEDIQFSLYEGKGGEKRYYNGHSVEEGILLVNVICRGKSWILTRSIDNFRLLDQELHRCLFDRFHSKLKSLQRLQDTDPFSRSHECRQLLQDYLARLSQLADDAMNCSAVLNWFELDNHGNHMLLTDESPINVPGIAAAHVIKRYTAQAADEISLEVGGIISVIDMPPVEESLWWRGKQGFQVGFFPSQCVEVIGDKTDGQNTLPGTGTSLHMSPVAKKRGKIVTFLRLFLSSRPSKARLLQSGILKERTFGCDLGEHLAKNNNAEVPLVLVKCSEVIESHGIVDGVYRLSGMSSNIQKLRLAFDGDEAPDLLKECYIRDIHCISSLLKMYFRELPNPLLTYHLYDKFVAAIQITEESERQIAVHHVVQQLPPPHYRTLEYLLRHLAHVASFSPDTGMHAKNLAIVWSPNLLRSMAMDGGGAALLQVNVQAVIIEYLIRNVHVFFDQDAASAVIVANPRYSTGSQDIQAKMDSDPDIAGTLSIGPRMASLSISPPTKLISLEEARARAQSTPSRPTARYMGSKPTDAPHRSQTAVYRTAVDVPTRRKSGEGSISGRKWKGFFNKTKSFDAPVQSETRVQETKQGTYVSVVRETRPQRGVMEGVRHARSAENLSEMPRDPPPRPAVRAKHVRSEANHAVSEIRTSLHQPVTISFVHQPVRERLSTSEGVVPSHVKRHPVLTSFKRVSSDQTVFCSKVEYHPNRTLHRRASTGGEQLEMSVHRQEIHANNEHRPLSVYDNRPVSIYDNEPPNAFRYSSPVFSQNYNSIPEERYRYSSPVNMTAPPFTRTTAVEGRLSQQQVPIMGARLAHTPLVYCANSNRPMH